jgi:hypothetical protein
MEDVFKSASSHSKRLPASLGELTSCTMRRLLRRGVSSGRERRRSVSESELRRPRKQPNARLKESVINKLATLKKLYNCPKEASARPQQLLQQQYQRSVVLWPQYVMLLLQSLLLHPAPTPHAASERQLYTIDLYRKI